MSSPIGPIRRHVLFVPLVLASCFPTGSESGDRTDKHEMSALRKYPNFAPRDARWFVLLMNKQELVRDVVKHNCMARKGFDYVFGYSMEVGGDFRSDAELDDYKHLVEKLESRGDRTSAFPTDDPDWMRAMTGGGADAGPTARASAAEPDDDDGCFGEAYRAIVNIHTPTADLAAEFNARVLDVLAGRPPDSTDVFDCMLKLMPAYRIHNYVIAERELAISESAVRPPIVDVDAQTLARQCGARSTPPGPDDLERLIAFENEFLEAHRERLDESLSTVHTATERAVEILSAPLEPRARRD